MCAARFEIYAKSEELLLLECENLCGKAAKYLAPCRLLVGGDVLDAP